MLTTVRSIGGRSCNIQTEWKWHGILMTTIRDLRGIIFRNIFALWNSSCFLARTFLQDPTRWVAGRASTTQCLTLWSEIRNMPQDSCKSWIVNISDQHESCIMTLCVYRLCVYGPLHHSRFKAFHTMEGLEHGIHRNHLLLLHHAGYLYSSNSWCCTILRG